MAWQEREKANQGKPSTPQESGAFLLELQIRQLPSGETDLFLPSSDTENALVATSGMSVSRPHKSQMSLLTIFATDGGKDSNGLQPLQQLDLK